MRRLGAFLALVSLLSLALNPAPAHASAKHAGMALLIAGGALVVGGVILYATRGSESVEYFDYDPYSGTYFYGYAEQKKSGVPGYVVGGVGIASVVSGAIVLGSAKPEQKQSSLRLTPTQHGIALAYLF